MTRFHRFFPFFSNVDPWNLTWNLEITKIETENHLNQTSIFGFHDNFPGGFLWANSELQNLTFFDPRYKLPKRMNQWGPMWIFQGVRYLVGGFEPTHLKKHANVKIGFIFPQVYRGEKKHKHILKPPPSEWNELGIFPKYIGVKKQETYFETTLTRHFLQGDSFCSATPALHGAELLDGIITLRRFRDLQSTHCSCSLATITPYCPIHDHYILDMYLYIYIYTYIGGFIGCYISQVLSQKYPTFPFEDLDFAWFCMGFWKKQLTHGDCFMVSPFRF